MLPMFVVAFGAAVAAAQASALHFPQKNLDAKLFDTAAAVRAHPPGHPERRVVCGMTLIPADPNIDSRMRIVAPSTPDHKIQAIRPRVCVD